MINHLNWKEWRMEFQLILKLAKAAEPNKQATDKQQFDKLPVKECKEVKLWRLTIIRNLQNII